MRRRLYFIAAVFAATLLFFVLQRGIWLIYYHDLAGNFSGGDILRTFLYGLHLDASTAGYVTALPLLAALATVWLPCGESDRRVCRRILNIYFIAVSVAMSWIFAVDMGLFEYWQARLDSQILIYSPMEMLASLTARQFIAGALYMALSAAAAAWVYLLISRRFTSSALTRPAGRISRTLVLLLAAGVLFVVIRGGFTPAAANVSKVYFSREMFLNQAAVNPVFSFVSTALGGDDYDRYRFYDDDRAEELFREAMHAGGADDGGRCGGRDSAVYISACRPHIVMVIMEGFGRTITDARTKEGPVAPNIAALKEQGVWFENLYASSFRTDRGTVALLSGFPAQPQMSIMKDVRKAAALPGLARSLGREGYRSRFFYGGDANFTNTRAYLFATGFDEVIDEKVFSVDGMRSKWGYADDAVMEYVADRITEDCTDYSAPRFDVWLTLSSHEPFEVPYSRLDDAMLNAFAFTDSVIGRLVEKLKSSPAWDRTLLILVPDHGYQYPEEIGYNTPRRHHIPMLWLGGAVDRPAVVEDYASQTDLAATLLGELGIAHDDFTFSRDLFRGVRPRFGYYTFNNGFGIVDSLGVTVYDCTSDMSLLDENDPDGTRLARGKAMLQKTFERIRAL